MSALRFFGRPLARATRGTDAVDASSLPVLPI